MQGPPPAITPRLTTAREWVVRLGREMGDSIWPGFRPDTIPVLYVVAGQGTLLLGWSGDLPQGFLPIDGLACSGWRSAAHRRPATTGTLPAAHPTAPGVLSDSQTIASLSRGTPHQAFYLFYTASKQTCILFMQ